MTQCSIGGCTAETTRYTSEWICSKHWRRHCPPRSLRRRAYHAFFRKAKRSGWTAELERQFWKFWDQLVRTANAAEEGGKIDTTEIHRMFGWTDEPPAR